MSSRIKITIESKKSKELNRTLGTLFSTRAGSQPADRDFGIDWSCLDETPEVAESLFYLEALRKTEKYEPRVEISDITYTHSQGSLYAHVYFVGKDEE